MEKNASMDVFKQLLFAGRYEHKLLLIGLFIKTALHAGGQPGAQNRIHSQVEHLSLNHLRHRCGWLIKPDQHHVILFEPFLPSCFQSPEHHVRVLVQLHVRQHSAPPVLDLGDSTLPKLPMECKLKFSSWLECHPFSDLPAPIYEALLHSPLPPDTSQGNAAAPANFQRAELRPLFKVTKFFD